MATATTTILLDGTKRRVVHVHVGGGVGDLTDEVVYDYSADTNNGEGGISSGKISKAWVWGHNGVDGEIEFDGSTDFPLVHIPRDSVAYMDFRDFGGIPNKATNPTGDVTISTTGITSTEHIQIIFVLDKH